MFYWYHGFNKWGEIALTDWSDRRPDPGPIYHPNASVWLVPGTYEE